MLKDFKDIISSFRLRKKNKSAPTFQPLLSQVQAQQ